MAGGRSLLVGRRRRADDEGEDEEGPVTVDESQSEGSVLHELDDEDEADVSSVGDPVIVTGAEEETSGKKEANVSGGEARSKKTRKPRKKNKKANKQETAELQPQNGSFKTAADTEAMMNGMRIDTRNGPQNVVDYATLDPNGSTTPGRAEGSSGPVIVNGSANHGALERPRREQDEQQPKRNFGLVPNPNRGNFFMHDTRSAHGQGMGIARGAWGGRGRGVRPGSMGGSYALGQMQNAERPAEQQWKHDLHDTINEETNVHAAPRFDANGQNRQHPAHAQFKTTPATSQAPTLSFSSTTLVGKVSIRVFFPGFKEGGVVFSDIPWKHYTRLPDHRPPLRRDKPVRISLPDRPQRYIFPALERSFVFIPRQMRPNQQGFGRSGNQRSAGSYGYSSRRTSVYGGSIYAGSVAPSRRSSFASVARDNAFSPVGGYAAGRQPSRPVVRLPHNSQSHLTSGYASGYQTPTGLGVHTFPLPQQPIHQSFAPTTTMHQPRPQKQISVTGIETPAVLQQSEPQPFQNQLPAHISDSTMYGQQSQPYYSPRQQYMYPQHGQAGTPLSGIPEQALQAQPFQPHMSYTQQPYYNPYQQPPPQNYYYPSNYPSMPMYPGGQGYTIPQQPLSQQAPTEADLTSTSQQQPQQSSQPSGMVAQEHNGMVFYTPASEAPQQAQGNESAYQPAESFVPAYAMPGLPPPTPPENVYYYPHAAMPQAQQHGTQMYYGTTGNASGGVGGA
jgi:hypothetical protein